MKMIRKATEKDAHGIYLLINDLEKTVFEESMITDIFVKQCHDENRYVLVYEEDDKVLGVCDLLFRDTLHNAGRICEIEEFVIDEKERGKGIGHQMIKEVFRLAEEKNCLKAVLTTSTCRKRAHHFYEREGMEMTHFMYEKEL